MNTLDVALERFAAAVVALPDVRDLELPIVDASACNDGKTLLSSVPTTCLSDLNKALDLISQEPCAAFAYRMRSHDLGNVIGAFDFSLASYLHRRTDALRIRSKDIGPPLTQGTLLKHLCATLLVVASQDPAKNSSILAANVPALLDDGVSDITYDIAGTHISSTALAGIYQLAKNAKRYGAPPIHMRIAASVRSISAEVFDRGPGFVDARGQSLDREMLPEVFGQYSARGGGFGLQLVRHLALLHRGTATIETTTAEGTLSYDVHENFARVQERGEHAGSRIALYLPTFSRTK